MTGITDPNHRVNSERVARHLAEILIDAGTLSAEIPYMDDLTWRITVLAAVERIAAHNERAGTNGRIEPWDPPRSYTPSLETRERVATYVRLGISSRNTARRPQMVQPADPFDGLPT